MCPYSKFKITQIYGAEFFDFRNPLKRELVYDYTINVNYSDSSVDISEDLNMEKSIISQAFDSYKTLVSEMSLCLFKDSTMINTKKLDCAVMLRTKLAPVRENFDEFIFYELHKDR
jgi:hypothetical protein